MGKNEALKQDLLSLQKQNSDALKVFGYVENIDELFRVTSCMITKPGGITLSEAAALQVPVILYKPVPGQENENAMYFERKEQQLSFAMIVRFLQKQRHYYKMM